MIGKILVCLRKRLDDYLRVQLAEPGDDPTADKVVFLDGDRWIRSASRRARSRSW